MASSTCAHRIGIQHVVHFYDEGYSAEMLAEEFPTLSLALIHKTIGFYLENRADIDAYIAQCRDEIERHASTAPRGPSLAELPSAWPRAVRWPRRPWRSASCSRTSFHRNHKILNSLRRPKGA